MMPGEAYIGATVLGFLAVGFSYKHLWFQDKRGVPRQRILDNSSTASAYRCGECQTTLLLRDSQDHF